MGDIRERIYLVEHQNRQEIVGGVATSFEPTTKVSLSTTKLRKDSGLHRIFGKLIV